MKWISLLMIAIGFTYTVYKTEVISCSNALEIVVDPETSEYVTKQVCIRNK
jgi:hypothetical protein